MKKGTVILLLFLIFVAVAIGTIAENHDNQNEWQNVDGSPIVCRVTGCGNSPLYSNWGDRFCAEHLYKSENYADKYNSSVAVKKINTTPALTREEAEKLKGTGYHGTMPNSTAEDIEIKAAMVKCIKCGMHSNNGTNSLCYECQYNKEHGFE